VSTIEFKASSSVVRKQLISIYLTEMMLENDVDVVEVMIVTDNGRPRTVTIPASAITGRETYPAMRVY